MGRPMRPVPPRSDERRAQGRASETAPAAAATGRSAPVEREGAFPAGGGASAAVSTAVAGRAGMSRRREPAPRLPPRPRDMGICGEAARRPVHSPRPFALSIRRPGDPGRGAGRVRARCAARRRLVDGRVAIGDPGEDARACRTGVGATVAPPPSAPQGPGPNCGPPDACGGERDGGEETGRGIVEARGATAKRLEMAEMPFDRVAPPIELSRGAALDTDPALGGYAPCRLGRARRPGWTGCRRRGRRQPRPPPGRPTTAAPRSCPTPGPA